MCLYFDDNERHLIQALESIQNQTHKANECIIVYDGYVNEEVAAVIENFKRVLNIKVCQLEVNKGFAEALNVGLRLCRYDYVIRADPDDICMPDRIEKQIQFMVENPDVAVCGMQATIINEDNLVLGTRSVPLKGRKFEKFAKWRSPLSHPTVCLRKEIILDIGGYPLFRKGQDYALWSLLLANGYELQNLPDVGIRYRVGGNFVKRRSLKQLKNELAILRFQFNNRFLSRYEFYRNITLRCIFRSMPHRLIQVAYAMAYYRVKRTQ